MEVERYKAKIAGGEDVAPVALRVTSIMRPEDGIWKVVQNGGMESQVLEVYGRLVSAFREGRLDDYFACFADDATLVFPGERWLGSLSEYRAEWDRLVEENGFAVLGVDTDVIKVQMLGEVAALTHSVETRQRMNADEETLAERETIVFARQADGRWLVVHEHLSPQSV